LDLRGLVVILLFLLVSTSQSTAFAEGSNDLEDCEGTAYECMNLNDEDHPSKNGQFQSDTPESLESESSSVWTIFKIIVALLFVVGLLVFLLKFVQKRTSTFHEGRSISTIGGVGVGNNRSVQLVKLGDQILVLGVGDDVQLLKEITAPEEVEKLTAHSGTSNLANQPAGKLQDWLKHLLSKNQSSFQQTRSSNFGSLLQDQLKEMSTDRKATYESIVTKGNKDDGHTRD
jgi:flagellar protein FliO/FliZ